ncbi:hypothetical protein NSTC731_05915 [Nostoc sp. DSM 114167]|jgi:hypothetical protein
MRLLYLNRVSYWALGTCTERSRSIGHWALVLIEVEVLGIGH